MGEEVCVGIYVCAGPLALVDTVRFLRLHTDPAVEVVLLPDGADAATLDALRSVPELKGLAGWGTPDARGTAACFNRLANSSHADVLVLLESGSLVGPSWLDLLRSALAVPGCGLAGPSTNLAWNEQAVFVGAGGELSDICADAALAQVRFGASTRWLAPLYSLADFCYAVRREVVDTIGPADEAYGLGPCWEMDYNVRAERAGWHGRWACSAYVWRGPLTERRTREEQSRAEASHRLYQDRFCGLRLGSREEMVDYRPLCRGDACEHFAPRELVGAHDGDTVRMDASMVTPVQVAAVAPTTPARSHGPPRPVALQLVPFRPVRTSLPLVSCVMPTRDRTGFALQAVRYFLRQDYPNAELVIVEDGAPALAARLPADERLRLISTGAVRSIGVMRNHACALATGEIVLLWDDDDWHGPSRISRQVAPILAGEADLTALRDVRLFDIEEWQSWSWTPQLHSQMLALDVLSGTVAFRRSLWDGAAGFPDASLAEDALFVHAAVARGARLRPVRGTDLYVYVRHGGNSWKLECGASGGVAGWVRLGPPDLAPADLDFYSALAWTRPEETERRTT